MKSNEVEWSRVEVRWALESLESNHSAYLIRWQSFLLSIQVLVLGGALDVADEIIEIEHRSSEQRRKLEDIAEELQ